MSSRQLVLRACADRLPRDQNLSACRREKSARQVEQRGLARAAGAGECQPLPCPKHKRDAVEQRSLGYGVADAVDGEQRRIRNRPDAWYGGWLRRCLELVVDAAGGIDHAAEFADAAGERGSHLEQGERGEETDRGACRIEPSAERRMGTEKQRTAGSERGEGGNDEHRLMIGDVDLVLSRLQAAVRVHHRLPPVLQASAHHQFALAAHHVDEAHAERLHGTLAEAR